MASNTNSTASQANIPSTMVSASVVATPSAAAPIDSAAVTLKPEQPVVDAVAAGINTDKIQVPSPATAQVVKPGNRLRQSRPNIPQEGKDVISERGEYAKRFNAHYRELVRQFYPAYRVSNGNETKRMLANEIISIIKLQGGRFFGGKSGREVMTHEQALVKVMKALKDHRRNDSVQQPRVKEVTAGGDVKESQYWHMVDKPAGQVPPTEQQRALELQAKARATAGLPPLPQEVAPIPPSAGGRGTAVIHTLNNGNTVSSPTPASTTTATQEKPPVPVVASVPSVSVPTPTSTAALPVSAATGPSTASTNPVLPAATPSQANPLTAVKPPVVPQPSSSPKPGVDVVCGRGEQAKRFNGHYRDLIRQFTPAYTSSSSMPLKRLLANEILNHIKSRGGRFFDGQGRLLTHHQSLVKTMKALKDAKRIHNVINHATLYSGMTGAPTTVATALGAKTSPPNTNAQGQGMVFSRPEAGAGGSYSSSGQAPGTTTIVGMASANKNQAAKRTVTDDGKQGDDNDDERVKNLSRDELEALGVLSQLGRAG